MALTKTASTEYLVQLFKSTKASGTIEDFINTFKPNKVTVKDVDAMMFFELEAEDAQSLLYTFNVFMAHITGPIYGATLQPKPTTEHLAYNKAHARVGAVIRAAFFESRGDGSLSITNNHCFFTGYGPGIVKLRRAVIIELDEDDNEGITVVYTTSFGKSGVCPEKSKEKYANFVHTDDYEERALTDVTNICYTGPRFKSDTRSYLKVKKPYYLLWRQHIEFCGSRDGYYYKGLAGVVRTSSFGEALLHAREVLDPDQGISAKGPALPYQGLAFLFRADTVALCKYMAHPPFVLTV